MDGSIARAVMCTSFTCEWHSRLVTRQGFGQELCKLKEVHRVRCQGNRGLQAQCQQLHGFSSCFK